MDCGKIYIRNNIWKYCDDYILTKFFFGCAIDSPKNFKKNRQEPASLQADKQLITFLRWFYRILLMFRSYVYKKQKMIFPRGTLQSISIGRYLFGYFCKKKLFYIQKKIDFFKVPTFVKEIPKHGALCQCFHASVVWN